jgi:hypothetical protein
MNSDLLPFEPLPILPYWRLEEMCRYPATFALTPEELSSMARELLSMRAMVQRLSDEAAYAEQQPSEG